MYVMYDNDCEVWVPGAHLVLSPITLETEPRLIERYINAPVRYILSVDVDPYSPATKTIAAPSCLPTALCFPP